MSRSLHNYASSYQCLHLVLQTSDIKILQGIIQTQHKPSLRLLYFYSCVVLSVYLQTAPAASSVVSWWCVNYTRESSGQSCTSAILLSSAHCHKESTLLFLLDQFKEWLYPMKLHLRFKQRHHYNNAFYVLPSSIRKIPLSCTNLPFPYCLGINQNNGLYLCSDLRLLICICVYPLT